MLKAAVLVIGFTVSFFLLLTPLTLAEDTPQNIMYVGGTGEGNYTSIQQAINDAQPGDTIWVFNGTYEETLVIETALSLIGENKTTTIIDAHHEDDVIKLTGNQVTIAGFTLKNSKHEFPYAGVGVYSQDNVIVDNIMIDNYYGMVLIDPASRNLIEQNHMTDNKQCGIYFSGATKNILRDNYIHNQPFNGFGLYDFSDHNQMYNNSLSANQLNGINIRDSYNNTVYNNTFIGNTYGVHMPPPSFQNILGENTYLNNGLGIDEEAPSLMPSLVASVVLTLFGFVIIKKKF